MYPEYESIFVESSEELGILYKSYKPILNHLDHFISTIENTVKKLNDDPSSLNIDLSTSIKKFKEDIVIKKNPEPIKIGLIKDTNNLLKDFKSDLDKCLERYAATKKQVKYGGSSLSAIRNRPKVYSNEINSETYEKIGKSIRDINRSLDWIEKCIIDLYALVDQDLDLLNIINRVYVKNKIYENAMPAGVEVEDVASNVIQMLPNATGEAVSTRAIFNTRDKKTGRPPKYLWDNHDMAKYGEDDDESPKKDPNKEITLDDYKRPSVEEDKPKEVTEPATDEPLFNDDKKDDEVTAANSSGTTNYYYYTYTNSMNRHSHDDHSVHDSNNTTKTVDNSIHSGTDEKEKEFKAAEESAPWELNVNTLTEASGDADDSKPKSDHPVKDALMDIDRSTAKVQQGAKRTVQNVQNVGRAAMKPINRTKQWVGNVISDWKDKSETEIKEEMADPKSRSKLFNAIKASIKIGALWQAGLLLNPVFIAIATISHFEKDKNKFRLRNEMIGELKAEMEIIDEKIRDADQNGDDKAKYQLMRFKNEINKKLIRVGGDYDGKQRWSKIL